MRYPGLDRLAWWLLVCGLVCLFGLSAHALLHLGYPYEAPLTGAFPFKIHPGTYLVMAALLAALASRGNPLRQAVRLAREEPLLSAHLTVMVGCLAWVLWRHGTSGAAFIVDTHWLPAFVAMTLMHFDDRRRAFLLRCLVVLTAANALIALVESALEARLIPLYLTGQESGFADADHFRASALLGHPLTNAKVMAAMLPIALLVALAPVWRWTHMLLMLLALLAFGGRAALAVSLVVFGIWGLVGLLSNTVRGRYSYLQLTGGTVLGLLGVAVIGGVVIASGLGERVFSNLYLDNSASVRLRVWSAYDYLSSEELLFGISAREIDLVAIRLGLDPKYEAIENGWIYLSMQFGLVVFGLWVLGFGALMAWLLRGGTALTGAGLVVFLLAASTSNSFAAKSISQALLVTFVVGAAAQRRLHGQTTASPPQAQALDGRRQVSHFASPGHQRGPTGPHAAARATTASEPWPAPRTSGLS
jgi:hypothetical protein